MTDLVALAQATAGGSVSGDLAGGRGVGQQPAVGAGQVIERDAIDEYLDEQKARLGVQVNEALLQGLGTPESWRGGAAAE